MKSFYPQNSEIPLLLDGRQSAIVRPLSPQPDENARLPQCGTIEAWEDTGFYSPFGPAGTKLWCKERWCYRWHNGVQMNPSDMYEPIYRESEEGEWRELNWQDFIWKSAIRMPKSACRLWLEVLEVKVCKLMDLTNEEMYETGVRIDDSYRLGISTGCEGSVEGFNLGEGIRRVFYEIFDEKFGKRKVTNPWIWYAKVRKTLKTRT